MFDMQIRKLKKCLCANPKAATFFVTILLFIGIASIFLILTFTVGKDNQDSENRGRFFSLLE